MKALEKQRRERYASVSELAADIDHYLREEPVAASVAAGGVSPYRAARSRRRLFYALTGFIATTEYLYAKFFASGVGSRAPSRSVPAA